MNGKKYFLTFFKKALKSYLPVLLISFLIFVLIVSLAAFFLDSYNNSSKKTRYRIGLVGNTEGGYLETGIAMVKNLDYSKFAVELVETDEESAKGSVLSGEMAGYIRIPDNFEDDISCGRETAVYYISKQNVSTFGAVIVREIAGLVSEITLKSQSAVFTIGEVARNIDSSRAYELMDKASMNYGVQAIGRNGMAEIKITGISSGLSMGGYYVAGVTVILLLLWGISCLPILFKNSISVGKLLYRSGVKASKQTFCEYAVYLILTLITFFGAFAVLGIAVSLTDLNIAEIPSGFPDMMRFFIGAIPAILLFTSMQFLIYEFTSSRIAAVILQFFITVVTGYFSGCFYPSYFFPEKLQRVAEILPVGAGFSYLKGVLASDVSVLSLALILGYFLLFAIITVILRKRRLAGDNR